jgi:ElaB/YqjD/DUF883 family membrane-anchored ribosome-binding protein
VASLVSTAAMNDEVRVRLKDLAQYVVSTGLRTAWEYTEQHPLKVIAGLTGAGFLLGVFLRARKRNRG